MLEISNRYHTITISTYLVYLPKHSLIPLNFLNTKKKILLDLKKVNSYTVNKVGNFMYSFRFSLESENDALRLNLNTFTTRAEEVKEIVNHINTFLN